MNEKERKLIKLLKSYPHPNHDEDDRKGLIMCAVFSADENGWTDEFIRICENNPNSTFDDILALIFTDERFPPLKITSDEDDGE